MPLNPPKRNPRLSLDDMHTIIDKGESIIHNGQVISKHEDLPNEEDLAIGDIDATHQALDSLESDIETLISRRNKIQRRMASDADQDKIRSMAASQAAQLDPKAAAREAILFGQPTPPAEPPVDPSSKKK